VSERYTIRKGCGYGADWRLLEDGRQISAFDSKEDAERIAAALNAQAGWLEQHARDGAELRRLCEARDQYKNEVTRLEVCLTEAVDNVVALRAELQNIADAKPHTWDAEVRDQFQEWAQSRARAALAALASAKEKDRG
jgi:hypothetical protein